MSEFEIGKEYQPKYGNHEDRFKVVDRDETYIYYTKDSVQNMIFRERYIRHSHTETILTKVWTNSDDVFVQS